MLKTWICWISMNYNREVVLMCWMQWRDTFCVAPHFANVTCFWDFLGAFCVAQRIHTSCGRDSILDTSWQAQQLMRHVCRRYCEQDLHRFVVLFLCFRWWWCSAVAWWQTCRKSVTTSLWKNVRHRDRWSDVPPILHLKNSAFGLGSNRFCPRQKLHYPMRVGRHGSLSSWFRVHFWRHCGPLLWPHYFANMKFDESQIPSQSNGTKLYLIISYLWYVYHVMFKLSFLQSFHQVSVVACCPSCLVIQMVILLRILFHILGWKVQVLIQDWLSMLRQRYRTDWIWICRLCVALPSFDPLLTEDCFALNRKAWQQSNRWICESVSHFKRSNLAG